MEIETYRTKLKYNDLIINKSEKSNRTLKQLHDSRN